MVVKQDKKYEFISVSDKEFTDDNGKIVAYQNVNVFAFDDNGELSAEPEVLGVSKEMLSSVRSLQRGEVFVARIEGYVKKPKIVKIKKG